MKNHEIITEDDYKAALARLEKIFNAQPGSAEGYELGILGTMVDNYEKLNFPIELPEHPDQ